MLLAALANMQQVCPANDTNDLAITPAIKNQKKWPLVLGPFASRESESQEATFVLTALAAGVCLVATFLFLEP